MALISIDDIVSMLGLTEHVSTESGEAVFTDEALEPESRWLTSVYDKFSAVAAACPDATDMLLGTTLTEGLGSLDSGVFDMADHYLDAIKLLHSRISFQEGVGDSVDNAAQWIEQAITESRANAKEAAEADASSGD